MPDAQEIAGETVDESTRCVHYDGPGDVVAIRCYCCTTWYPCHRCHDEAEDHDLQPWPTDRFQARAVHCGACGSTLTIQDYLDAGAACPVCETAWNPGCEEHHPLYFDLPPAARGSPALRVGLLTAGLIVAFLGLGLIVVGLTAAVRVPILGIPPGPPQALLGVALALVGIVLGQAAWDLAFPPGEEE